MESRNEFLAEREQEARGEKRDRDDAPSSRITIKHSQPKVFLTSSSRKGFEHGFEERETI
jgi:hypothetical protein